MSGALCAVPLLAVVGSIGFTAPASAETLPEALARAYEGNPTLNAQRANTRATDEAVPQALSDYRPTVIGSADAGYVDTRIKRRQEGIRSINDSEVFSRSAGVTLNQNLFNGFQTKNNVKVAESSVLASRETLLNTEQNVLFDGVEAYMNVLRDFAIFDLRRNNVDLLGEELRATNERFQVGEVTRTDTALSESRLAGARSDLSVAEANLKASRAVYRQVIGNEPTKLFPGKPVDRLLPPNLDAALQVGFKEHPATRSAFHAVDAAAAQVRVAQGVLAPSVDLQGSVSTQRDDALGGGLSGEDYTNTFNGTVLTTLTVPIYQGGQEYSVIRQAKETLGQRRLEAEIVRDQVRAAIVSAWGALEGAKSQIIAAQAQVDAAQIALNGVREENRVGQRTTLDVLNFTQDLLDARVTLITAQRDRVVASYALLQAIGRLNVVQLNLKVATYDSRIHYDQVRDRWFGQRTPDGR